jgi:endonuclease/exonuclease/phosphatase family metal-dependent hydrolase
MSFNVRYAEADDGEQSWDRRRPVLVERIRAFDPDLLGLQELSDGAAARYVRRRLAGWTFVGIRSSDDEWAVEMAPIFFKRRAFEQLSAGHFWLSETPEIAGSLGWDAAFARTATWAELRHRETERTLTFLNTHVDYEPRACEHSAMLLRDWIERTVQRQPVVITGDFNAIKGSPAYNHLAGNGSLADTYRCIHSPGPNEGSYHGYGTVADPTSIDWILASSAFEVRGADVDRARDGRLFPSDHDPVTAVLEWKHA